MKFAFTNRVVASIMLVMASNLAFGQLLVDSKNVSDDKAIEYIQLMYYIDQKTFRPVYSVDYGVIDSPESTVRKQKILINNEEVKDTMSPIFVMNAIHKCGWQYLGDASYLRVPLMENLVIFTFQRRKEK